MRGCQIFDRHGNEVLDRDEDEPLRDGESMRVPMFLMDSTNSTALQRAIAEYSRKSGTDKLVRDARRKKIVQRDPMGRLQSEFEEEEDDAMISDECTFTDSRGVTFTDHRIADTRRALERLQAQQAELQRLYRDGAAARQQAHEDMMRASAEAWRADAGPPGAYPYSVAAEGGPCTVNGERGVLVREGNYLVCKPGRQDARPTFDTSSTYDAVEGERRKREAWLDMIRDSQNAWRGGK